MILRTAAALAACLLASAAPAWADTLLDNINGVTLDEAGKVEHFTGLIFDRDGRIVQLLDSKDKRPKKIDYRFDGAGRFVVPGIVDSHVSLMRIGYAAMTGGKDGLPPPRPEDRDVALQKAQRLLAAQGITAVADMGTTIEDWQTYRRAGDSHTLYLRIMAYAGTVEDMALIGGPGPTPWLYDDRLRFNGLYLRTAGTANGSNGVPTTASTQLRNRMSRAAIDNFQVAVAASNHAAVDDVLDAIDELKQTYQGERRWRLESVRVVDPAQTTRAAADGAIASFRFGAFERDLTDTPANAPQVQPWQSVTQAGVKIAYASGAQSAAPAPFADMAMAIARGDTAGEPQPQERLTREGALAAMTANGALAGYGEGRFGRLATGERADFVMLDRDPMLASPADLRTARVIETWVGGARIYVAGQEEAQKFGKEMPGW
ncbi:MAG: amidohydrolase family protein [Novosphingobium sp.]|nr:amidohydrolase family protein [Novosphingobium sp.]